MGVAEGRRRMGAAEDIAAHNGAANASGARSWAPRTISPRTMERWTMAALMIDRQGGFSTSQGLRTLPHGMRVLPLDQADNVANASSPSSNGDNGSYERVSSTGEDD